MCNLPGFKDGIYKGTKNQHIVPQLHLKPFADDNGLIHAVSMDTGKHFNPNIKNICSSDWIYDFNPEDPDSMENILRIDETWMGSLIKRIDSNDQYTSDELIRYVSMLIARSLGIIESVASINSSDSRTMVKQYYKQRKELLNGHSPSLFDAFIRTSTMSKPFLTADIPYFAQEVVLRDEPNADKSE